MVLAVEVNEVYISSYTEFVVFYTYNNIHKIIWTIVELELWTDKECVFIKILPVGHESILIAKFLYEFLQEYYRNILASLKLSIVTILC